MSDDVEVSNCGDEGIGNEDVVISNGRYLCPMTSNENLYSMFFRGTL